MISQRVVLFTISLIICLNVYSVQTLSKIEKDSLLESLKTEEHPQKLHEIYFKLGWHYSIHAADSAFMFLNEAKKLIYDKKTESTISETKRLEANIYANLNDYITALTFYIQAMKINDSLLSLEPENIEHLRNQANIYSDIGLVYWYLNNYEKSLEYYNLMLGNVEKISNADTSDIILEEKIILLNNLGGLYLKQLEYDKALDHYKQALKINEKYGKEELNAILYNNIGISYMGKKDFDFCYQYHQKAIEIREELNLKRGLVQSYNNMADYYILQDQTEKAIEYATKAYELGKLEGMLDNVTIATKSLYEIYVEKKEFEKAFYMLLENKQLNDSILNEKNFEKTAKLEMQYRFEKERMKIEFEHQKYIEKQKRIKLIYISIIIISILSLMIFGLLYFLSNSRRKRLSLEYKNIELAKDKLDKELDFKNKELTTNVIYLLQKNEFMASISKKLLRAKLSFKKENQRLIEDLIKELDTNIKNNVWDEFELRFTRVHSDFYEKLNKKFPDLSPNEKKLCAFLRLNMSTKDISAITFQSVSSITMARSRLRKKMGMERDENLITILAQM